MPDTIFAGSRARVGQLNNHPPYRVDFAVTTTNTGTFTTTETAYITSNSVTLKNNRAYRFDILGLVQHASTSATGLLRVRVRRTSTTGNQVRSVGAFSIFNGTTANVNNYFGLSIVATNTTGSDLTDVWVVTLVEETGTAVTFTGAASAGNPATLMITDIGPSSDFPGAAPIT